MKMMPLIRIPSAAQGHADKAQPFNYAASPISTNLVPEAWRDYFRHMNLTDTFQSRDKKSPAGAGLVATDIDQKRRTIPRTA